MALLRAAAELANLTEAWEQILANDLADGDLSDASGRFQHEPDAHLEQLRQQLLDETYRPSALFAVDIPKSNGDSRELHIPTLHDRIVERALGQVLVPLLDPCFAPCSFAYRPGLGVRDATRRLAELRDQGNAWVVRTDIDDCFDTLDRKRILEDLAQRTEDEAMVRVVELLLERPTRSRAGLRMSLRGEPQGGPISPLLCNLYLHRFDLRMLARGFQLVRYADDIVVAARDKSEALEALAAADAIVRDLDLRLGEDKTDVTTFEEGFAFLGEDFNGTYPVNDVLDGVRSPERKTLYVTADGAWVRIDSGQIVVARKKTTLLAVPSAQVGAVVVCGSATMSSGSRTWALSNNVEVTYLSRRGEFLGWLRGPRSTNATRLRQQLATSDDPRFCVELARHFVAAKLANLRTMLLRYADRGTGEGFVEAAKAIEKARNGALSADLVEVVRGFEGAGSAAYFGVLPALFPEWTGFSKRVRRPPTDAVNSALSFGYKLLTSEATGAAAAAGLDPAFGYLHEDAYARPSLACDLVEEFRAPIIDSVVAAAFRGGVLTEQHFRTENGSSAVFLTDEGRRRFIERYEQRMLTQSKHLPSGKQTTYRRALFLQARQVAGAVKTGIPCFEPMGWRR